MTGSVGATPAVFGDLKQPRGMPRTSWWPTQLSRFQPLLSSAERGLGGLSCGRTTKISASASGVQFRAGTRTPTCEDNPVRGVSRYL
jgi:hypothetical protein